MKSNILTEKILVVDANIDYSRFMQKIFKDAGYLAYIAASYKDALKLAYEKIPDCILIDHMLPYSGAFHLTDKIKADNILQNIPIIFLTAVNNKNECLNALESGADGFFLKSIDTDILVSRMRAFIRQKKLLESNIMYMTMLKQDIEYAAKLQKTILSYGNSKIPRNDISVYHYAPNEVSGDYSGIKELKDGWYAVLLTDVSGHGVAASMLTILIKSFFDSHSVINAKNTSPSVFIKDLNDFFISENFESGFFATVFYALYNNNTGEFICSSGGSPKPLYFSSVNNKVERINIEGPLIGMSEESYFEENSLNLKRNDVVFIFTDGAYEVFDGKQNMFGEAKLKSSFSKLARKDVNVIKKTMISKLKEHGGNSLQDDISMIIIRRTE